MLFVCQEYILNLPRYTYIVLYIYEPVQYSSENPTIFLVSTTISQSLSGVAWNGSIKSVFGILAQSSTFSLLPGPLGARLAFWSASVVVGVVGHQRWCH